MAASFQLFSVLAISFVLVATSQVAKAADVLHCYRAYNNETNIPDSKINDTATGAIGCSKIYRSTTVNDPDATATVEYEWSYFLPEALTSLYVKCDEVFEISGSGINDREENFTYYERHCICCGELCNDEKMNDICNETPKFTKTCYSVLDAQDQYLPADAALTQCTDNQSCYKMSSLGRENPPIYAWGCASIGSAKCEAWGNQTELAIYYKGCTCCGDTCNGAAMNGINASPDTYCIELNTTTALPTTTQSTTVDTATTTTIGTTQSTVTEVHTTTVPHTTTPKIIYLREGFDGGSFVGGIFLGFAIVIGIMAGLFVYNRYFKKRTSYGEI